MNLLVGLLVMLLCSSGAFAQDFGDDSTEWVYDSECDDGRFEGGTGAAQILIENDSGEASITNE